MITLYGRANAWNVRKVLFFIEEIGLPYERLDYGRGFAATNTPEFLAMNPMGMVPVLKDGPVTLWESHSILRYLASKYADERYYPRDLDKRAVVDQWLDWKLANVAPALRALFFHHFLKMPGFTEKELADSEAECAKLFTVLNGQLEKTGAFVTGPDMTVADCAVGMGVHRWLNLPLDRPVLPHVERYYRDLSERPAYQSTVLIGIP